MLFSANNFEQFFNNRTLKKALKIFTEERIILSAHLPNGEDYFLIDSEIELKIKKRAEKILSYCCSCGEATFCCHLGSALFYFQQDALGSIIKPSTRKKKTAKLKIQKEISDFHNEAERNSFFTALAQVKAILAPCLDLDRLNQKQIDALQERVLMLIEAAGRNFPGEPDPGGQMIKRSNQLFYLHLAVFSELPVIFRLRLLGNESPLTNLLAESKRQLTFFYEAGLTHDAMRAWTEATLTSGRIKNHVGFETFTTLLPGALCLLNQKEDLERLKTLVHKRRSSLFTTNQFNRATLAKLQVAMRDSELFGYSETLDKTKNSPEYAVAGAELLFWKGKSRKALKALEVFYETIKSDAPNFLPAYCEYIIQKAREKDEKQVEKKYLKEIMVRALYIKPDQLERFYNLTAGRRQSEEIHALIDRVKSESGANAHDKLAMLLLRDSKPEKLLAEIKGFKKKFVLVHKIALQKFPVFDDGFLALYADQLGDVLTDPAYMQFYTQIFSSAVTYLDLLPRQKSHQMILRILKRLVPASGIYRIIKKKYPSAVVIDRKYVNRLRGEG